MISTREKRMRMTKYLLVAGIVVACADRPAPADTQRPDSAATLPATLPAASGDSLRGIVGVRGNDSVPDLVLVTGGDTIAIRGSDLGTLRRVIGFDVAVRGARSGAAFDVAGFVVRAFHGERVTDGTLDVANGGFFVRTEDGGRADISQIPPPLRGEIGSRIYLVGPLDRLPSAFGVISEGR
jgi:hypothetical protein